MYRAGRELAGFASLLQHRYASESGQGSGALPGQASQHFRDKLEKLGAGKKDHLKNTARLETLGAELAKIPTENQEARSAMVSLLATRLAAIASSPDHSLAESHVQEMCRLLFEHSRHTPYRDTPDARYPGRTLTRRAHNIAHSKNLWDLGGGPSAPPPLSQKDDTNLVSKEARTDVINAVRACLARHDGSPSHLPFNPRIQQYLCDLLRHNIESFNKQTPTAQEAATLKTALKDAAIAIAARSDADKNRFVIAAALTNGAASIALTSQIDLRTIRTDRARFLRSLPALPSNPRIKRGESREHYQRHRYPARDDMQTPATAALYHDLVDIIVPIYQTALQHPAKAVNGFERLIPLKYVLKAHLESIKSNQEHERHRRTTVISGDSLNLWIGCFERLNTQLDRHGLTAEELPAIVNSFLAELRAAARSTGADDEAPPTFVQSQEPAAIDIPEAGPSVPTLAPPPAYGGFEVPPQHHADVDAAPPRYSSQ